MFNFHDLNWCSDASCLSKTILSEDMMNLIEVWNTPLPRFSTLWWIQFHMVLPPGACKGQPVLQWRHQHRRINVKGKVNHMHMNHIEDIQWKTVCDSDVEVIYELATDPNAPSKQCKSSSPCTKAETLLSRIKKDVNQWRSTQTHINSKLLFQVREGPSQSWQALDDWWANSWNINVLVRQVYVSESSGLHHL